MLVGCKSPEEVVGEVQEEEAGVLAEAGVLEEAGVLAEAGGFLGAAEDLEAEAIILVDTTLVVLD